MGNLLKFKAFEQKDIAFINQFYGHLRISNCTINNKEYQVILSQHQTPMTAEITLDINGEACVLQLANLPTLSFFEKDLEGIVLSNLPEAYQIISLKTATEKLIQQISEKLSATITLKAFTTTISKPQHQRSIDFLVNFGNKNINACKLFVPDSILILISKHLPTARKTQSMKHIKLPYHICVGTTAISKNDYENLQKNDIIFFDQHILDKNKIFDMVGLDRVQAKFVDNGVAVTAVN